MKNIIFLISDQMQKKAMDPNGACITPNLDALRKESVTFDRAHTVNAICSPARASVLTGLYPHKHGMVDCTHTVPEYRASFSKTVKTLPQILKKEGYSMCYYGKWHVEHSYKLEDYGFDEYETENQIPKGQFTASRKVKISTDGYKDNVICGVFSEGVESTEEAYVYNKGMEFIDKCIGEDKPFCTFLSTYAPHDPYAVPEEIYKQYENMDIELSPSFYDDFSDKPNIYKRLKMVWKDLKEDDYKSILKCYYSYCSLVDVQLGNLVKFLKEKGVYDDTLIVFTSDHGDLASAHGLFCKGVPAFEEGYEIPLVIKNIAGEGAGQVNTTLANTCDIFPTILEAVGLEKHNDDIDGESLLPYVRGKDGSDRHIMSEFFGQRYSYTQRIVWHKNWKYVFNGFDFDELYDLEADPFEIKNVVEQNPEKVKELAEKMWECAIKSNDTHFIDTQYYMHRILPIGPSIQAGDGFSAHNKTL